jgi:hypothetical protein
MSIIAENSATSENVAIKLEQTLDSIQGYVSEELRSTIIMLRTCLTESLSREQGSLKNSLDDDKHDELFKRATLAIDGAKQPSVRKTPKMTYGRKKMAAYLGGISVDRMGH